MSISDWKGESSLCVQGEIGNFFFPLYETGIFFTLISWYGGDQSLSISIKLLINQHRQLELVLYEEQQANKIIPFYTKQIVLELSAMKKILFFDTAHIREDYSVSQALSLNYFSLESSLVGD